MSREYHDYALAVSEKRILTCEKTQQAVKRYLSDLKKSESEDYPYYFDEDGLEPIFQFLESLTLADDRYNGKKLRLLPFQQFIVANLFGWKRKADRTRRFRRAFISTARKQGVKRHQS